MTIDEIVKNIREIDAKSHEEILAGWDKLIKEIVSARYDYFWNKGYDDFMHSRTYQEQLNGQDMTAYHSGWLEAQYKCMDEI